SEGGGRERDDTAAMDATVWESMHAQVCSSYADSIFVQRKLIVVVARVERTPSCFLEVEEDKLNKCSKDASASMLLLWTIDKYVYLVKGLGRVFCKKGCDADSDSWEDCVSDCSEICYKDPVLKDRQWSAYIDRSPGAASYSEECFHACVAGCGYKFEVESEEVNKVKPKRPPPPPPKPQPPPRAKRPMQPPSDEDVPTSSA
ncbi:hypothetical protein HID58_012442, partial [Brassica napus]